MKTIKVFELIIILIDKINYSESQKSNVLITKRYSKSF